MTKLPLCCIYHLERSDLGSADTAPRHEVGNGKPTIYGLVVPHASQTFHFMQLTNSDSLHISRGRSLPAGYFAPV